MGVNRIGTLKTHHCDSTEETGGEGALGDHKSLDT